MNRSTLFVLFPLVLLSACAMSPEQAPATPQRPTLSSDTNTTALDTLEVEAGAVIDPSDAFALPTTVKWGTSDHTEMFLAWSPYVHIDPGFDGSGDVAVGVRHRVLDERDGAPSAAFQVTTKLPTANDEVGTGETDFFAAAIVDKKFEGITGTAFYQLGVLGNPTGRGADLRHDLALAAGGALDAQWGMFGELAGTFVSDQQVDSVFTTLGATFAENPGTVFDVAIVVGLSDDAPDFQLLFGCTYNLGKIASWFR